MLEYKKIFGKEPRCLVFSLAALIMFYRTDESNDDAEIMEFMKKASPAEILKRTDYWGEDLSELLPSVEKYIGMIEKDGIKNVMKTISE